MKKALVSILIAALVASCSLSAFAMTFTDKDTVKAVQQALNDAGFECGTPDGSAGKKTKAAIAAYREANGMEASEEIDDELVVAMGVKSWFDVANAYYNDGVSIDELIPKLETAVSNDDRYATTALAQIYEIEGTCTQAEYLTKLADQGNRWGCYYLAICYHDGKGGVDKDVNKAIPLYEQAAEAGVTEASANLAEIYSGTNGVEPDYEKAKEYLAASGSEGSIRLEMFCGHREEAEQLAQQSIEENGTGYRAMAMICNTIGDYETAGEWFERGITESTDDAEKHDCAVIWAWEHATESGVFYDQFGNDWDTAESILANIMDASETNLYLIQYIDGQDYSAYASYETEESWRAAAEAEAAEAEAEAAMEAMPDLEQYLGATKEEIEAALPDADYDEYNAEFHITGEDCSIDLQLGSEYTCKEITMRGTQSDYKLHGMALGISYDAAAKAVNVRSEDLEEGYYCDFGDGDGYIHGSDGVIDCIEYTPQAYAEDAITAETNSEPYAGPEVTPVDENDLVKYLGMDKKEVEKDLGVTFEDSNVNVVGLNVLFEGSDAWEWQDDDSYAFEFCTYVAHDRNDYYNTDYVTYIYLQVNVEGSTDYSILGLNASMTQEEADAYIASLDPEIAQHLYFGKYDNGGASFAWNP